MQTAQRSSIASFGLVLAGLALTACGGGGGGGGIGSSSDFVVASVSVQPGATVQINRQIEFTFTQPVDFSTVNFNTISITQVGGGPAAGEYRVKMQKLDPFDPCSPFVPVPNVIVFQPACPTVADFSDAGLTPGGVQYQVNIVGAPAGGTTVMSTSGESLGESQTLNFVTPLATQPEVLFVDPVVNSGPRAVVADPACTDNSNASYIELGGDPSNRVRFQRRPVTDANLGADVDVIGFLAPLNLYSDASTRATIVLQIDQPVNPSAGNVNPTNIRLEYLVDESLPGSPASWANVPHTVAIEQNCTTTGARVRVTPTGILPQGRLIRVVLAASFSDIVGNGTILDTVVGSFRATTATDPGTTNPGPTADAFTEEFNAGGVQAGSQQDTTTPVGDPPADWGQGKLEASFNFGGTGGPGGNFIWKVRPLANGTTILNTSFQLINGEDENGQPIGTQAVINGQVDIKDLHVLPGAILEIRGPNPCVIRASGTIRIEGKINLKGSNNRGVVCFNCANTPEAGATGNASGGRGGSGNYLTTQSTPQGESGYGPFNLPGGGGQGGESSYGSFSPLRPGGGGGGSFAIDVPRLIVTNTTVASTTTNPACPDQATIGLDAENGSNGAANAIGAISGATPARGGLKGPRPFLDNNPVNPTIAALDTDFGSPFEPLFSLNDFWGTMRAGTGVNAPLVTGELGAPWAGSGGGGGGSIARSLTFPSTPFSASSDLKGAGGGGGGGALTILCLGDVIWGENGRIDASGGTGGGGENTSGTDRLGGGSGGGSGGHIIIQAGGKINFAAARHSATNTSNYKDNAALIARGGEGGEGANGVGGAHANSIENGPGGDMLPPNSYGTGAPCAVTAANQGFTNTVGTVIGAGGDGGPGVIQLHVSNLSDIILPPAAAPANQRMRNLIHPPPVGALANGTAGGPPPPPVNNIENPLLWRQLLPIFGRNSTAISKWIPLGSTSVPPTGSTPEPIMFFFAGTNPATGLVQSVGGTVPELPAVLTGAIVAEPGLPFITADSRSIVFDASTITDDVYLRNPALTTNFELKVVGAATTKFDIASAAYDPTANTLRVTVSAGGMPLAGLTGTASLIPRFFRISTDGMLDALPSTGTIKIEFQAAPATSAGLPNETLLTPFVTDITQLNSSVSPANTTLRFFRFRVRFEIGVGEPALSSETATPALEFLKVPFKF